VNRLVSMKPTIEILISSPLCGSEAAALCDLARCLTAPSLILANFEVSCGGSAREIDFVVVTQARAELIELKNLTAPVKGGVNGPWQIEASPGIFVPYSGPNPWEQARDAKLALSDAMHEYAKGRSEVPLPARRRYYEQFDASVSVYPLLVPGSQVSPGNFKAWVRSFPDTLQCLNSRPLPVQSTWAIGHWRDFAIEHLGLLPASLSEAIDSTVFQAHQSVEEYAVRLCRPKIPPLLAARDQELLGQNVIEKLKGPADALLLGRSGLGKSFHLEHYRRICFESDEVPILLHARYYQGDLNRAIHKSIGPYTRQNPAELLDAAKQLGRRPVLIVDGWNDCPEQLQIDLGNDLSAFKLRYNARLVAASQTIPSHELFAALTKIELDPLREEHKQTIFAFHAGKVNESIPPNWYELFSTAFDLAIAGRCQTDRAVAESRWELYESYIRSVVPSVSARTVLRKIAWYMGEKFKPALPLGDYERILEQFIQELGLNLSIADELLNSPLIVVDREVVAFEHDLLRDYFRAEYLLREAAPEHLAAKLDEPKYNGLAEFVVPSLADESLVHELLLRSSEEMLNEAFRGLLGTTAQRIVRNECQRLLNDCRDRLPDIAVEPWIGESEDGRRFVSGAYVVGSMCASDLDRRLCSVIANNLGDETVHDAFLELLDLGEWALKEASERVGRERGVKPGAIFRELVHRNVMGSHSGQVHAFLFLTHLVRQNLSLGSRRPGIPPFRNVLSSVVTVKPAICGHFKTGHRDWPKT
jgi:Nuclease-related domain